jgi:hypothetical protein
LAFQSHHDRRERIHGSSNIASALDGTTSSSVVSWTREHFVRLVCLRLCILAIVPETHLKLGEEYSSNDAKLATFHDLSRWTLRASGLSNELIQWSKQGSILNQYAKALWLGLRTCRGKLAALGLPSEASRRIVCLRRSILSFWFDKICRRKLNRSFVTTTYLT